MFEDRYGLALSTSSPAARDAYVEAVDAILSASGDAAGAVARCIDADADFALAHAADARLKQLNGRMAEAREAGERAARLAAGASARERAHAGIFALLTSGRGQEALGATREHVRDFPLDAFALAPSCSVFGLIGFSGRAGREPEQLELLEPLAPAYGDDWWFLTVYAFALIEMGQWQRGRELVERALEQRPRSAHSAHVRAHALYEGGEDRVLADYLTDWLPDYQTDGQLSCHLWWHLCLVRLMLGETDAIWPDYDAHCAPGRTQKSPPINVFTDGAALLWRAELAGVPRSEDRWRRLLDYRREVFPQPMVFVDAHGALPAVALADGAAFDAWVDALETSATAGRLPAGTVAEELAHAFDAYAREDWDRVIVRLSRLMPQVVRIGGSRAQRDLVRNTLASAYVRAGRAPDARALLHAVAERAPTTPVAGLA